MAHPEPIAAVTQADPYPFYRALVAERPVYRDTASGLWVVSSAAAVTDALENAACRVRPAAEPVPKALDGSAAGTIFGNLVRMTDGPGHATMKQAVRDALASADAAGVAREARAWLAERVQAAGTLDADALNAIIFELPVSVVASLVGVPRDLVVEAASLTADFVRCIAAGSSELQLAKGKRSAEGLVSLFSALSKGGGLLGRLREEARGREPMAVLANAIGFLSQTYEATAGLIGNTLLAASAHPQAYRRAVERGVLDIFVSEVSRHDPSVHNTRRFVAEPATIAGEGMRAGEAILVVLAAANPDPSANPAPERFDIDRIERRSFTFGRARHGCPGEMIATAIAAAAAEILVPRLAGQESVGYLPLTNVRIPVFGDRRAGSEVRANALGGDVR
jgi:cytochrome P450